MKIYFLEVSIGTGLIYQSWLKANDPDDAFFLISCEVNALGFDIHNVKMRIIDEQPILNGI
jgi:hypothetical protein